MAERRFAELPAPPAWQSELTTVGVTGTNGKTSTTWFVGSALAAYASPVAMVNTLGSFLDRTPFGASHDYPGFIATMQAARERGGTLAAIELTSEALALGFAHAWPCRVGIFTNLTRDHLDAHGSAEHYLASKAQLFMQLPEDGVAILNAGDPASALLTEVVPAHAHILRYGVPSRGATDTAELRAESVVVGWDGTRIQVASTAFTREHELPDELTLTAIGEVFAENALAALASSVALGVPGPTAAAAIEATPPPPGRFEVVSRRPHVVVDYAHTPDALSRTLVTARNLCPGSLHVVFGAGGERDKPKRPLMGEAASTADLIVLTADNPRGESPAAIADEIRAGITAGKVRVELDRRAAITSAIAQAGPNDVVVIAGKGHEQTQDRGGERQLFSDVAVARRAVECRA